MKAERAVLMVHPSYHHTKMFRLLQDSSDDDDSLNDLLGLGTPGFGIYLDELVDDALDEEEMEDPDAVNDPLFQLNLQVEANPHMKWNLI